MERLEFHPEARQEFHDAVRFYAKISSSLGGRFVDAAEESFRLILDMPLTNPPLHKMYRRNKIKDFPYAIVFRQDNEAIYIVAVMHQHRDPDYWKERIGEG